MISYNVRNSIQFGPFGVIVSWFVAASAAYRTIAGCGTRGTPSMSR